MHDRPDGPSVFPLSRTSAALSEILRDCFLRAAFQTDPQFSNVRLFSTASILGTVSHQLLEEAAQGRFDSIGEADLDAEVAQRWEDLVELEEQAMREQTSDSAPAHIRWPKYALRKATACRMASRVVRERGSRLPSAATPTREAGLAQVEVWYEGYGGRLAGRIDLIRRTSAGIELVDYKTGLVTEQDDPPGAASRIRERYERQVLLYAALVYENEGQWPVRTTVDSLIQGPHEVLVTPERAQAAVGEALGLLNAYNSEATAKTIRGHPGESTCRWCDFKAICVDFLEAAEDWWGGSSATVSGRLGAVSIGATPSFGLVVTGGDHLKQPITIRGVPSDVALELSGLQGTTLSFSGLRRSPGSDDLLFDWATQAWRW